MKKKYTMIFCLSLLTLFMLFGCKQSPDKQSYSIQNIKIKIGSAPYPLDGVLCLPKGVVDPPVVIMVQGSGQSDYDETISLTNPFKDIAEGLAKQGVATLRFNKRYYQYPRTAPTDITIEDEVLTDVALAIRFADDDSHTKNSQIFVLGHSLGGMLAPYIARTNKEVKGIVILAGTPRRLEDVILDQNIAAIQAMTNKTDAEKQALIASVQTEVDKVKNLKDGDPLIKLFGVPSSYWLSLNKIDTPAIAKSLRIPMLILQGSADFQVSPVVDYQAWQDLLKDKSNVTFKLYDKLNHLFIVTNGKKDITEYSKRGRVDQQVITDIALWVKQR
ncbi:MAG: alpha/beta fold hydrolase [Erysipelotrichaceae bacterium]